MSSSTDPQEPWLFSAPAPAACNKVAEPLLWTADGGRVETGQRAWKKEVQAEKEKRGKEELMEGHRGCFSKKKKKVPH